MVLGVVSRFGVSCPIPEAAQALPTWSRVGGLICLLVTVEVSQELYQSSLCAVLQALRCQVPLLAMCLGSSIAGAFLSPNNLRGCLVSEALAWSSALRLCSAGPQSPTQAGPTAGAARGHRDLSATRALWTLTPLSCQATVPGCATRPLPGEQQGHTAHLSPQATAAPCPSAYALTGLGRTWSLVLCGTPVLAMPRAWQQHQGGSAVSPPRFGMLLC